MIKKEHTVSKLLPTNTRCSCIIWITIFCGMPTAFTCDVPVFSYAMQYWESLPYRATVFHDGQLSREAEGWIAAFNNLVAPESPGVNLETHVIDCTTQTDDILLELRRKYLNDISPGIILQYPLSTGIEAPVFAGALNETLLHQLVESSARNSIIAHLTSGKVAVWVLLESGNTVKDDAAATMLEKELQRMEQTLQLPEEELWAWSDKLIHKDGKAATVRFPVLRVSREEAAEQVFIRMLLCSEPDLLDKKDVPIAFPIYGRGLILYALVGTGINEWTIAEACKFIVGSCSCFAKASNPGTELLLSANWSQYIGRTRYDTDSPPTNASSGFEQDEAFSASPKTKQNNPNELISYRTDNKHDGTEILISTERHLPWLAIGFVSGSAITVILFFATYLLLKDKKPK